MQVFIFYIPLTCLKGVTYTYTNGISSVIETLLLIENNHCNIQIINLDYTKV